MRLDLDFNDGRGFGGRQQSERLPTDGATFLLWAQVADVVDDREGGTGPATVPWTAGLLAALTGAGGRGVVCLGGARRLFAFRPLQALLGEVTDRGLLGVNLRLQGRFPFHQLLVLRSPVVRLPLQFDIGLFR